MAHIDPYLLHQFEAFSYQRSSTQAPLRNMAGHRVVTTGERTILPMLLRVTDPHHIPAIAEALDCKMTSHLGSIVACTGSERSLELWQKDPRVISIEASRPGFGFDCSASIPFVRANTVHENPLYLEKGEAALIAVIDDGLDVLHQAFQDGQNRTRILSIWDQHDQTGPSPTLNGRSSYGTVHTEQDINRYISTDQIPHNLGRNPGGHGTHVASIAAGRQCGMFHGGVAPEARLVFVKSKITVSPDDPHSTGYSNSHIDALNFIANEAERVRLPLVVNISQGMNAGAHDGTSNLETAIDSFLEGGRRPGRAIVKSAGNERDRGVHAQLHMPSNAADFLSWYDYPPHVGQNVIELWFSSSDEFQFSLQHSGEQSMQIRANQSLKGILQDGTMYQMSYEKFHWDNGDSRLLVTLTGRDSNPLFGEWKLNIRSHSVSSGKPIHAWLERDNNRSISFSNHLREDYTITIPGTARHVITVGSVVNGSPLQASVFSSYGPTRDERQKPDLSAPGESITAACAGTVSETRAESGTSMAAPHVTGAVALALSRQHKRAQSNPTTRQINTSQIRAALIQTTQNYNGHATPSMGFGILDVKRFLDQF